MERRVEARLKEKNFSDKYFLGLDFISIMGTILARCEGNLVFD